MSSSQNQAVSTTYVHIEGTVCLSYTPDARYLYSGGADGIRCFDLSQAIDDVKTIEYHRDAVTFLDCSVSYDDYFFSFADHLASCSESGEVVLHEHSTSSSQPPQFKCLLTRSLLPSRCLRFSPNQTKLAISSDELVIKIVDVNDPLNCQLLTGHTKPVKSICWSPDSTQLISSGCEGVIRIWDLSRPVSEDQLRCTQAIEGVIPTALPEECKSLQTSWHPSGKYFIAPLRQRGIAIFGRESFESVWKQVKTVCQTDKSSKSHSKPITASAFSQNGKYLATGCEGGLLIVWDTLGWEYVTDLCPEIDIAITSIQWRPQANSIAFANFNGQVTTWQDVVPPTRVAPFLTRAPGATKAGTESPGQLDDDHPENRDDFDADLDGVYGEDWVIDNEEGFTHQDATRALNVRPSKTLKSKSSGSSLYIQLQKPFQPCSTKVIANSQTDFLLRRRYMAFNMLGIVQVLEKDDENIITVEFHDRGKRSGYHFVDRFKFNLSCMSELGVAFACGSKKSGEMVSVVRYDPFETWATDGWAGGGSEKVGIDKEASWQYELPQGESAICLACGGCAFEIEDSALEGLRGSGAVVIGTNKGYVRIFTGSGMQRYIWNLGQQIIALACNGDFVFVVHRSSICPSMHPLNYSLMDTSTFEVIQEGAMPLPNDQSVLNWIGFSEPYSIPACYDSSGVLSFLDKARRPRQGRWVPVLDTTSLKTEGQLSRIYWPVGVTSEELSCIIIKGGSTQPSFPTPLIQTVPLQMPALRLNETQGQMEECFLRESMIHSHKEDLSNPDDYASITQLSSDELELEKKVLKLIESCCKNQPNPELQKALDYSGLLKNLNTLEASIKICKFFNLSGLSDRVSKLHEAKELQGDKGELAKRASKYSHLEDYSIIAESKPDGTRQKSRKSDLEIFDRPFENNFSRSRKNGPLSRGDIFKNPSPQRRKAQVSSEAEDDLKGLEASEEASSSWINDEMTNNTLDLENHSLQSSKRPRLSEHQLNNSTDTQTRVCNSKSVAPPSGDVKKTGLFFERVDAHSCSKNSENIKIRQSTLFELTSKKPSEEKLKKRKNECRDEDIKSVDSREKIINNGLQKSKVDKSKVEASKASDETQETSESNQHETQESLTSIDFSQSLPPRIRSTFPEPMAGETDKENPEPINLIDSKSAPEGDSGTNLKSIGASKLEAFRSKKTDV
ncbi:hypothetical protein PPACK8108_LOCUS8429 [Phakopsora pachyrhizi]|uniref:Minichromosome loss protein Mcl1 middle region domain-containing protein n=1 Tax=Phakopsora pachyrhizi TaxID=170000 RepID=A0AAV0AXX5_PHAPC|nr:hypothetical protein PPACK8108_LOCUS8429 [Phakopsora pachyrhizi]